MTKTTNPEILDRMPPADLDAERMTIGSIFLDPCKLDELTLILRPDDFHADQWRRLYGALLDMRGAGLAIDERTILDHVRSQGELEAIGGLATIAEASASVAVAAHAVHYARIVRRQAIRREIRYAGEEMIRQAHDDTIDVETLLDRSETQVLAIRERGTAGQMTSLQDGLIELHAAVDRRMRDGADGIKTGLRDLDDKTGGLRASQLIIVAARTGCGKTSFAINISDNVADSGRTVAIFSLEMSREELVGRIVCSRAGINGQSLRSGKLSQVDRERFLEASSQLAALPLWIDDRPTQTVAEIAASCRRLKRAEGLSLVVVDYLQLIEPEDARAPRQEQVARASRRLKALAKEITAPVLCLCQLNRQADGADPRLSHLRESGAIEQDADVVLMLHQADRETAGEQRFGEIQLKIAKQRSGPVAEITLAWDGETTTFSNHAKPHQEPYSEFTKFA